MKGDLKELFKEIDALKECVPVTQLEKFQSIQQRLRNSYDQLNNLAYFNLFLNVGNWNKMLNDYKRIKHDKVYLVAFTTKKDCVLNYEIETILESLKLVKNVLSAKCSVNDIYFDRNTFYVLTNEREKADYVRRLVKRAKTEQISYASYFVEVAKDSVKDLKNLLNAQNIMDVKMRDILADAASQGGKNDETQVQN